MTTWTRYTREGTAAVWHDGGSRIIRRTWTGDYVLVDFAYAPIPADWRVRTLAEARELAETAPVPEWDHLERIPTDDPRVLDVLRGWKFPQHAAAIREAAEVAS